MSNFCSDYQEIKATLDKHNIKKLYHFTTVENLSLISKCNGLWSKGKLEKDNLLDKILTGGNELSLTLDKELGNWHMVHLYFCPHTPMVYNKQSEAHLCYFLIKPDVALRQGVFFTNTNATKKRNGHKRAEGIEGLKLIDFDVIKLTLKTGPKPWDPTWHRNVQAECLIPREVPIDDIEAIKFISEASLKEGERLWGNKPHPPFKINKNLFHEGFPVLDSVILTSSDISKDDVDLQSFEHEDKFCLGVQKITLLTSVKATPCLEAKTVWFSAKEERIHESTTTFENENTYWHWPSINAVNLSAGEYYVEYYIGNIRWITISFTLFDF